MFICVSWNSSWRGAGRGGGRRGPGGGGEGACRHAGVCQLGFLNACHLARQALNSCTLLCQLGLQVGHDPAINNPQATVNNPQASQDGLCS
jgi:hypothetical protein